VALLLEEIAVVAQTQNVAGPLCTQILGAMIDESASESHFREDSAQASAQERRGDRLVYRRAL
jgi:crotonobetainyl-CoA:carnitine CoA-transferase CaiB-like acyl-CoA transferase